jgi:hypothetical protein
MKRVIVLTIFTSWTNRLVRHFIRGGSARRPNITWAEQISLDGDPILPIDMLKWVSALQKYEHCPIGQGLYAAKSGPFEANGVMLSVVLGSVYSV